MIRRFISSFYLSNRFFIAMGVLGILFVFSYFFPVIYVIVKTVFNISVVLFVADVFLLFMYRNAIRARRISAEKLSNGDDNPFIIELDNMYPFPVTLDIYDELPAQFQLRDNYFSASVGGLGSTSISYNLRPFKRGNYNFGSLNIYVHTLLGLAVRRFKLDGDLNLPVYPSFIQMRKYEFLAIHNRLQMAGIKKIRRIGNNTEFEQIKEYVQGDDYRTVNWKATARKGALMVNQFQDERSQNIYCVIDKGRMMKMPFENLSLLDYSINAALALSNIALRKSDKAGVLTFNENKIQFLQAESRYSQLMRIADLLHQQKTRYMESNYEALYVQMRHLINHRSLVILFTNFESLSSMQRNLKYLLSIASHHTLVVVFFENTEISKLLDEPAHTTEEIYVKTIADKFAFEKRQIVLELQKHGINTLLTPPESLTVNAINKYLELKARGLV
jgi:uncharacterized protein (DUF58 family)